MSWFGERKRHSLARRHLTAPNPDVVRINAKKKQLKPIQGQGHLPNALQSRIVDVSRLLRKIVRSHPSRARELASNTIPQYVRLREAMNQYMQTNSLPGYMYRDWAGRENWRGSGMVHRQLFQLSRSRDPSKVKSIQKKLAVCLEVR